MSEIPEDILSIAKRSVIGVEGFLDSTVGVEAVAKALMAERERCAKVVERMLRFADTTSNSDEAIAAAIRRGD